MKTKLATEPIPRTVCSFCGKYVRIEDRRGDKVNGVMHIDSRDCLND